MDEATSQLDLALENHVNTAIRQLNMARIIIAYRPQTIFNADRIVLLQQGQLTDVRGSYKKQMKTG